ncbi:MAG: alanine racemase [Syntrophomonadaceae bacterium]|nr:alanine racemase [Syntrophomonadaceae bacterium]
MLENYTPRWVEVDLDAIKHNLNQVRRLIGPKVKVMAVVKADAYGHGAVAVARLMQAEGVEWLAVTTLDEGIELRRRGIEIPILVFAPLLGNQAGLAVDYHLTPSLHSEEAAESISRAARYRRQQAGVHLKIETGMGRTGLSPNEAAILALGIAQDPYIKLEGIYTHLAVAMSTARADQRYTEGQYRKFVQVSDYLARREVKIPLRHVCNSAATLAYPHMHLEMVRPGTLLYGQYPSPNPRLRLNLRDAWQLKARVLQVQEFPAGTSIGYGRTKVLRRRTRVAVLPVGYVDGFSLEPVPRPRGVVDLLRFLVKLLLAWLGLRHGEAVVEIEGRRVPVLGKVAMQFTMVDVTGVPQIKAGTVAVLSARRTTISRSLPKIYLQAGQPWLVVTLLGEESLFGRPAELASSSSTSEGS